MLSENQLGSQVFSNRAFLRFPQVEMYTALITLAVKQVTHLRPQQANMGKRGAVAKNIVKTPGPVIGT